MKPNPSHKDRADKRIRQVNEDDNRRSLDMTSPWTAKVLTLYPEMFPGPLAFALAGRALHDGKWAIDAVNLRDFAMDKHGTVDDTPAAVVPVWCCAPM